MDQVRNSLKKGEFSAVELAKSYIQAMEKNRDLNAFITETSEIALKQAEESDKRIKAGNAGLMEGMPIAIKDLFCTKGVRTTASSKILENFIPEYESTVTSNLFSQGAVMLGKVACDEFAMGSTTLTSFFGTVKSPWKDQKGEYTVPGGSSGGSSTAVSGFMAIGATGTDTGGSIRQPASFTGLVGAKPTYGRCSRWGTIAFASSLDQAGPMTRTVRDSAIMLEAMAGYDQKDSTSANRDVPCFENAIGKSVKGMRIGIPKEYRVDGLNEEISKEWDRIAQILKDAGAELVDISLATTKYAGPVYYIIAPAEASANLSRYDGVRFGFRADGPFDNLDDMYLKTRSQGFGDEVQRRILMGTYVLSSGFYDAYFTKAQKVRRLIAEDFKQAFEKVDAILTPSSPSSAYTIGKEPKDPLEMYLSDIFTIPASMAGLPAMNVPTNLDSNGLPLGMQLISKHFDENTMFSLASVIEEAVDFQLNPNGLKE